MKAANFRVRKYKHPKWRFVVRSKITGKWARKFFETKREAETYSELKEVELLNQGTEAASFPSDLRILATRADAILKPFGKTVLDGAEFYAAHLKSISSSKKVSDVISELVKARTVDGASADYLSDLNIRLGAFSREFGDSMIAALTAKAISDWLRSLKVGPVSRNTVRSRLATLFSFAKRSGYTKENPIADVERAKERETVVGILTITETTALMEAASFETLPYWAIGAFAGLRTAEIERLEWHDIDFESKFIDVKASKAKTASRRLVTMLPNLHAWIAPYQNHQGMVCPIGLRKKLETDRDGANLLKNWPSNALRHSFGSYHLAQFKDAAALALQMGNSPRMIFRHYREVVKPKDAVLYWEIKPSVEAGKKIVAFATSGKCEP